MAHSGQIADGFNIAKDPPPQPVRLPGAQGQLCQEHTVSQPASFVPGHSYRLSAGDRNCLSGDSHNNSAPHVFLQGGNRPTAQSFPENAGPYGSGFARTSVGSASYATYPALAETVAWYHGRHRVTVTRACVSALAHWRDLFWLKQDVTRRTKGRLSWQTPTRVGERCVRTNQPSLIGPRRSPVNSSYWAYGDTMC